MIAEGEIKIRNLGKTQKLNKNSTLSVFTIHEAKTAVAVRN